MTFRKLSGHPEEAAVSEIAHRAYRVIAGRFPICAASDEFYFFPQVVDEQRNWSFWDDFSADSIEKVAHDLRLLEHELEKSRAGPLGRDARIDADLVRSVLQTLREQLVDVAPHRSQPTFHLTVVAAGLAEALAAEPPAWTARLAGLPPFLKRAASCLDRVPRLFLRSGREMLTDLLAWTDQLQRSGRETGALRPALATFGAALDKISGTDDYRMSEGLLARLVDSHMACGLTIEQATADLTLEFHDMQNVLESEASRLAAGLDWREVERRLPFCTAPEGSLLKLYALELERLERHCREHGLVPENLVRSQNLQLKNVPAQLEAIRASDAYSATPGYPPQGGTFYVLSCRAQGPEGKIGRSLEYRMTAIHEAWPGHHLLDQARWSLNREVRRPIEHPLFYEGWACLAEELMARTGYLDGPWDRFLLARRRIARAARGLVDLGLQVGSMTLEQAIELLVRAGYRPGEARRVIPKYLLRPGYQLCYTIGLRQGLQLLEAHDRQEIGPLVRKVLAHGEVGFERLAKILADETGR
ncbi:MAG TPA: DUF885 family protein [Desulfuromonadales bacterium]|nr:DUF885 family protein [Desulfuromonadales bacterium]